MKLKHFLLLLLLTPLLLGCHTSSTVQQVNGNKVFLSPCLLTWSVLVESQREKPLGEFEGCDILTSRTLRDIKDNNDKLHERR